MITVVGGGRVGTALASALGTSGCTVTHLSARALPGDLDAEAYLLAVRDPFIASTATAILAAHRGAPPVLLHTAGGLSSAILREAGAAGGAVLHPLAAFAGREVPLAGVLFAIEGDDRGRQVALALVTRLRGQPLVLDAAQLARYHAAAVLASNHVLALVEDAARLLRDLGVERTVAQNGLASLFSGVAENLVAAGLPLALTGPIARGDIAAVERHLAALEGSSARATYLVTAGTLVGLARDKGEADPAYLDRIDALLARSIASPR